MTDVLGALLRRCSTPVRVHGDGVPVECTFDTHAAVNALRNAGIEEQHAEAIVNTVRDAADVNRAALATKDDIGHLREDLVHFATKADLYQVALGMLVANAAIMFDLLKLVP